MRKVPVAVLRDQDVILDPDATDSFAEAQTDFPVDVLARLRVSHRLLVQIRDEVAAGLNRHDNARHKHTAHAEAPHVVLIRPLMTRLPSSDFMAIKTHAMTKTVRVECSHRTTLDNLFSSAVLEQTSLKQSLSHNLRAQTSHVRPGDTRLGCSDDRLLGIKNSLVNKLLVLSELAVRWERASVVGRIAVVLTAGVNENKLVLLELPIVVVVVKSGTLHTSADDRLESVQAAVRVNVLVLEDTFDLLCVHANLGLLEDMPEGIAVDVTGVLDQFDFVSALDLALLADGFEGNFEVHLALVLEERWAECRLNGVDLGWLLLLEEGVEGWNEEDLIELVTLLQTGWRRKWSHPNFKACWQIWVEEGCAAGGKVDVERALWVIDAGHPEEAGLLANWWFEVAERTGRLWEAEDEDSASGALSNHPLHSTSAVVGEHRGLRLWAVVKVDFDA